MKPKILLTGKNGQIGHELATVLPRLGEVIALGRQELDLSDPEAIRRAVRELRPQLIINAVLDLLHPESSSFALARFDIPRSTESLRCKFGD